ncbi:hypothetical protein EDB84DRAFT_1425723 [Lactarius hengduanensis]|nr:hypothetical protein EDB84DRAFT_1425723 [Lactarius hengduanensis]
MIRAPQSAWAHGGGFVGFYQGLDPWVRAWIEASTKGGVLLYTALEVEMVTTSMDINPGHPAAAGSLGGMGGGISHSGRATVIGFVNSVKTAEIARHKEAAGAGVKPLGIRGVDEGVNAVAVRQCTSWYSRQDWSCSTDSRKRSIRTVRARGEEVGRSLGAVDKILASTILLREKYVTGGDGLPAKLTIYNTFGYIYEENGIEGPRRRAGSTRRTSVPVTFLRVLSPSTIIIVTAV